MVLVRRLSFNHQESSLHLPRPSQIQYNQPLHLVALLIKYGIIIGHIGTIKISFFECTMQSGLYMKYVSSEESLPISLCRLRKCRLSFKICLNRRTLRPRNFQVFNKSSRGKYNQSFENIIVRLLGDIVRC